MTPSSPDGDELEKGPPEIGDEGAWYPFKTVPNVRTFKVTLRAFDPIFALFGIRKRFSPIIEFDKFKNHKYNRYMENQLQRLEDARIGKMASRHDFYEIQMINVSKSKVVETFTSYTKCAEALFGDDGVSSIEHSAIYFRIGSKEKFI